MKKSKIFVDPEVIDSIANSKIISEKEKISFLKHIKYLTRKEQYYLINLV